MNAAFTKKPNSNIRPLRQSTPQLEVELEAPCNAALYQGIKRELQRIDELMEENAQMKNNARKLQGHRDLYHKELLRVSRKCVNLEQRLAQLTQRLAAEQAKQVTPTISETLKASATALLRYCRLMAPQGGQPVQQAIDNTQIQARRAELRAKKRAQQIQGKLQMARTK